jgi:hypothetical protein
MVEAGLRRFWISFEPSDNRLSLWSSFGCGVTAYDYEDAIAILGQTVFAKRDLPKVQKVIADVDVRTLDAGHVLTSMGAVVWRGVWFPKGFPLPRV